MKLLLFMLLGVVSLRAAPIPPSTYNHEAEAWRSRILTNNGTLTGQAYQTGTRFMNQATWWDVRRYMGRTGIYLGTQSNAMVMPIVADWFSSATIADQWVAFVAGDYSEATGLTGDGTSKYILVNGANAMGLANHTVITDLHMATYVRTASNQSGYTMGVSYAANSLDGLPISYANVSYLELCSAVNQLGVADTNGTGLYISTRSGSNRILWKNGVNITNSVAGGGTLGAGTATVVHALNSAGTVNNWTSRALSYYCYGLAIPDAKVPMYDRCVRNVQEAYNRQ